MKTTNKNDLKTLITKESAKVSGKPIVLTKLENEIPIVDVNKPELSVTEVVTAGNEPVNLTETPVDIDPSIPVLVETDLSKSDPESNTDEVNPLEVSEKTDSDKSEQPKPLTKAERAKGIYDEMIKDPKNDRSSILARIKKELVLTKAGAQTYFYKFQKESGIVTEKLPTKVEKAKVVYDKMTSEGQGRKEIIAAFIKDVELTPAGASTYFQNLKKAAADQKLPV
jgi:hypothetical protein